MIRTLRYCGLLLYINVLIAIIAVGCGESQPIVDIIVTFEELEQEEFNQYVNKPPELQIEDVRKLTVIVIVENAKNAKDLKVDIPWLIDSVDRYDRIRSLRGSFADYEYSVYTVFEITGLDEEDIRKMFDAAIITVTWSEDKKEQKAKFYITEYIDWESVGW